MVSDETEFAVEDIERMFEEARRNTKTKHEKWEKYNNRRRRDVQIKVRIYRHRKCDETEIGTGSSDNGSLRDESRVGLTEYNGDQMSREMVKRKGQNRREETVAPTTRGYNLRPRIGKREEFRPTIERKTQQGGPVQSRKGRERNDSPYIEE
ncbi:uncharacterized protein TNCV_4924391 [Trichonephila clavipes]|nr:uncharacterized protein TNCV_4924391 [Trichonephila clavipes]